MKIKQQLLITNPDEFLRGDYHACFNLFSTPCGADDWIECGEIELEINISRGVATAKVVNAIDAQIKEEREEFSTRINILEEKKQQLLALTHES